VSLDWDTCCSIQVTAQEATHHARSHLRSSSQKTMTRSIPNPEPIGALSFVVLTGTAFSPEVNVVGLPPHPALQPFGATACTSLYRCSFSRSLICKAAQQYMSTKAQVIGGVVRFRLRCMDLQAYKVWVAVFYTLNQRISTTRSVRLRSLTFSFFLFWWRGLMHSKGARTAAASVHPDWAARFFL
jgi:hypothetical protein